VSALAVAESSDRQAITIAVLTMVVLDISLLNFLVVFCV
jgi:hypothetical protein